MCAGLGLGLFVRRAGAGLACSAGGCARIHTISCGTYAGPMGIKIITKNMHFDATRGQWKASFKYKPRKMKNAPKGGKGRMWVTMPPGCSFDEAHVLADQKIYAELMSKRKAPGVGGSRRRNPGKRKPDRSVAGGVKRRQGQPAMADLPAACVQLHF